MNKANKAQEMIKMFCKDMKKQTKTVLTFEGYLNLAREKPEYVFRNHFHFFHDIIKENIIPLNDANNEDPENIGFIEYDSSKLFEKGVGNPFFSDTLFNNQLMQIVETMYHSSQQNKIYIVRGPHGSGKSTFINNLMQKCEEKANSIKHQRLETLWKINKKIVEKSSGVNEETAGKNDLISVPCPSHDPPILVVPIKYRKGYLEILFKDNPKFLSDLMTLKRYEWVLKDRCCTICDSIFWNLFDMIGLAKTLEMINAQIYEFDKRLSRGINIFNPDDNEPKELMITNPIIKEELDSLFKGKNRVLYEYSKFAQTNYGFYVLMDIKKRNRQRLEELHNIISEGTHKNGIIEEKINSIFIAVMNPEDMKNGAKNNKNGREKSILHDNSFKDRIENLRIPRILDPEKEIKTYCNTYEHDISRRFLPEVLLNFAKIIISTRMKKDLGSFKRWISDPGKYRRYCDEDLILLRMELYKAKIPNWLLESDKKKLDSKMRRAIISEAIKNEGEKGCSGRDSIRLFYKFYSPHANSDKLIDMSMLVKFFQDEHEELNGDSISDEFLDSLVSMYNYSVLQKIKESAFYYNKQEIIDNIKDYLFAIFEKIGLEKKSPYTGRNVKITKKFLDDMENAMVPENMSNRDHDNYREKIRNEFSKILSQELSGDVGKIENTKLYKELYEKYYHGLRERVLDPILKKGNTRQIIKDYGTKEFSTHDEQTRKDVERLIGNMQEKFGYTEKAAKDVCLYAIDEKLNKEF